MTETNNSGSSSNKAVEDHIMGGSLDWRMDPASSNPDWIIETKFGAVDAEKKKKVGRSPTMTTTTTTTTSENEKTLKKTKIYHVHRCVLAVGPRSSLYFCKIFGGPFQEAANGRSVLTLDEELQGPETGVFECLLDYVYGLDNDDNNTVVVINSNRATALHSLAQFLAIPALASAVEDFVKKDLNFVDNCHVYYEHASKLHNDTIRNCVFEYCSKELEDIKPGCEIIRTADISFWTRVLDEWTETNRKSKKYDKVQEAWTGGGRFIRKCLPASNYCTTSLIADVCENHIETLTETDLYRLAFQGFPVKKNGEMAPCCVHNTMRLIRIQTRVLKKGRTAVVSTAVGTDTDYFREGVEITDSSPDHPNSSSTPMSAGETTDRSSSVETTTSDSSSSWYADPSDRWFAAVDCNGDCYDNSFRGDGDDDDDPDYDPHGDDDAEYGHLEEKEEFELGHYILDVPLVYDDDGEDDESGDGDYDYKLLSLYDREIPAEVEDKLSDRDKFERRCIASFPPLECSALLWGDAIRSRPDLLEKLAIAHAGDVFVFEESR